MPHCISRLYCPVPYCPVGTIVTVRDVCVCVPSIAYKSLFKLSTLVHSALRISPIIFPTPQNSTAHYYQTNRTMLMNTVDAKQGQRSCHLCNATSTSQWRYGGAELLCNACGIRYRRRLSKRRLKSSIAKTTAFRRFPFLPLPPLSLLAATATVNPATTTNHTNVQVSPPHCAESDSPKQRDRSKIRFLLNDESTPTIQPLPLWHV